MSDDPYRRTAAIYRRFFDPMIESLRIGGIQMFIPARNAAILDVGCGTGAHLALYRRYQCKLFGVDTSPTMLAHAKARLGDTADLRVGDAANMPFHAGAFDLVICMLALHEMDESTRRSALVEFARVVKPHGRLLLIDYHAGTPHPVEGWLKKTVIIASELAAGRRHFRHYRRFMADGGLPRLVADTGFTIDKAARTGGNTIDILLLRPSETRPDSPGDWIMNSDT